MSEHDDASLEAARKLFAQPCSFRWGATSEATLPPPDKPEVAFAGRSNIGKSSLINALTGRKTLAKTSQTPGRTQQINFFDLAGVLDLVDLPGYGYAKASKTRVAAWQDLIVKYLKGRVTLRRVMLLIDGRHGLKDSDLEVMRLLDDSAVPYRILATKWDKVKPAERAKRIEGIEAALKKHPAAFPQAFPTSSLTGEGIGPTRVSFLDVIG